MTQAARRRGRPPKFDRQVALGSAAGCFAALGYEGASIPNLTAAMGVSAQSLYAAFGSKAQLFEETIDWFLSTTGAFAARALAEESDPIDGLIRVLTESARFFADANPRGCLVCNSALAVAEENQAIAAYSSRSRNDRIEELRLHLKRALDNGHLHPDVDVEGIARLVMSIRQGMSAQARDGASINDLLRVVAAVTPTLDLCRASKGAMAAERGLSKRSAPI